MKTISRLFNNVESFFLLFSKIALLVMMVLTSIDALGRYLFNKPIVGAYEFTERYLMIIIVFLSMSYVMKLGGHIRLDLVLDRLSNKMQSILNVIFNLLGATLMFLIGFKGLTNTYSAWINNEVGGGIIAWPFWLSYIWIPIGAFLFVIRLLLLSYDSFSDTKKSEVVNEGHL